MVLGPRSPILCHTCATNCATICGTCGTKFFCATFCGTYFLYFTCDPFYSFSNPLIPTTSTLPNYFLLLFTLLLHPTIVFLPILHSFSTSTHLFMLYSIGNTARFPKDHTPQVRPDLVSTIHLCFQVYFKITIFTCY